MRPIRGFLVHVDFLAVKKGEKVSVEVPIHVEGELAPGGNLLEHVLNALPVEAEATHIPESVTVSVAGLEAGASVLAKDIALPKGISLAVEDDAVVLQVVAAQAEAPAEEARRGRGCRGLPRPDSLCAEAGSQRVVRPLPRAVRSGVAAGAWAVAVGAAGVARGVWRVAEMAELIRGWWWGWVIRVRSTRVIGTTWGSWWRICWRSGSGGGSRRTRRGRRWWRGGGAPGGRARVVVAKPMSFMNLSGGPMTALRDFYKVPVGGSWRFMMSWTSITVRCG